MLIQFVPKQEKNWANKKLDIELLVSGLRSDEVCHKITPSSSVFWPRRSWESGRNRFRWEESGRDALDWALVSDHPTCSDNPLRSNLVLGALVLPFWEDTWRWDTGRSQSHCPHSPRPSQGRILRPFQYPDLGQQMRTEVGMESRCHSILLCLYLI